MVKTKGNINTPMAQLFEIALEEESAIRSERLKETLRKRDSLGAKRIKIHNG
jgi:hypothetical protein